MTPTARQFACVLVVAAIALGLGGKALAQLPTSEERLKILTEPEDAKKKGEKERTKPPLELSLTQVAPFDVLPYVKPNHWSTLTLELISNYDDFSGVLATSPVAMVGLPQEILYRREARLPKTQRIRLSLQMFLPAIPKEIGLELARGDGERPVESWASALKPLEPHQMVIVFLSKEPGDTYALWNRFQAIYPNNADRSAGNQELDKLRYYRFVVPLKPDHPPLSPHPLTWTTISHIVWDGMPPDNLNAAQQEAMVDWLHWGGQLIVVGGPGPGLSILKDSFLAPYLPAETTGENALLKSDDLDPLSQAYPPPFILNPDRRDEDQISGTPGTAGTFGRRYLAPAPIVPRADRPVYLAGLKPKAGAVGLSLGESSMRLLGVEQRVGRGRILLLSFNPNDPALAVWPGLDTFIRRVILRRPEEGRAGQTGLTVNGTRQPRYGPLAGPDLSWVRFMSRDMGGSVARPRPPEDESGIPTMPPPPIFPNGTLRQVPADGEIKVPELSVADWNDASALPKTCRVALEQASGIKIPNARFVLGVIVAYILMLVPLNWLICRYLFNRRELAWIVVPALSLAFALGVERAAAYDLGYDTACDEIDLLETYADYPRALVSRFASLYSNGRTRFSISFPNDPTALALPLDNGRSLRGEDVSTSVFQSFPTPGLAGYLVQPRSLALFRAEQMATLDGSISLSTEGQTRHLVNGTGLTLRDAVVVDLSGPDAIRRREVHLGTIAPGATVEVKEASETPATTGPLDPTDILTLLRQAYEDRPENSGEIRLVAWVDRPVGGEKIEPAVDRHRGYTAVVVHLRHGPPPSPDGPFYFEAAAPPQTEPAEATFPRARPFRGGGSPPGPPAGTLTPGKMGRAVR